MANLPESAVFDAGVYQLETSDPVQGGVSGVSNAPAKNLANRTTWLKQQVDSLLTGLSSLAGLDSPTFTGTPAAPTPPLGDNTTKISTTAFVQATIGGILSKSVAGNSNVTLTAVEAGNGILVFTGLLTGNINVIVPAAGKKWIVSNQTTGAFSLTVKTAGGSGVAVTQTRNIELWCDGTNVVNSTTDFVSTALTGSPTAPTATSGDNDTSVATTGFVMNATDGISSINVAGAADVTVTGAQAGRAIIELTGLITAHINLIMPNQTGHWVIKNGTTGAFNITCKTAAGTGVVLPQSSAIIVYGDATNIYAASSAGQQSMKSQPFAPSAGTTTLTVLGGYTPGNVLLEKNGSLLEPSDFTATNGTSITVAATVLGDTFTGYFFESFTLVSASTPPQFDNDTSIATSAFVQRALGNIRGFQPINVTPYTIASAGVGYSYNWGLPGNGNGEVFLPEIATIPPGSVVLVNNLTFLDNVEVKVQSTDQIRIGARVNQSSVILYPRETAIFYCNTTIWYQLGGAALIKSFLGNYMDMKFLSTTPQNFVIADAGGCYVWAQSAVVAGHFYLPESTNKLPPGTAFTYFNDHNSLNLTIHAFAGDGIQIGTTSLSDLVLLPGQTLTVVASSGSYWRAVHGSVLMNYDYAVRGDDEYQCFASGMMMQVFHISVAAPNVDEVFSFPESFVGAAKEVFVTDGVTGAPVAAAADAYTSTQFTVKIAGGSGRFNVLAWGRWK